MLNLRFRSYEWEGVSEASRPFLSRGRKNRGRPWLWEGLLYTGKFAAEMGLEPRTPAFSPNSLGHVVSFHPSAARKHSAAAGGAQALSQAPGVTVPTLRGSQRPRLGTQGQALI